MLPALDISPLRAEGMPFVNLEQYSGLWAIEEHAAMSLWQMVTSMDLSAHVKTASVQQAAVTSNAAARTGGKAAGNDGDEQIALIEIRGVMTKAGSSLSSAGSMVMIRQAMRAARMSKSVDGCMVIIDTPGGTVAGIAELAQEYAALSAAKPTVTYVEDLMASAGLWAGSQGRKVFANSDHAQVGSKGVFSGMLDLSEKAAKEGVKPVIVKTGDLKGAGFPGTAITEEQQASAQALINQANASFDAAMGARKLSPSAIQELSRGGMFSAKTATSMGLIDGVRSFDEALSELRSMISQNGRRNSKMTENTSVAANLNELEAACRGADEGFLLGQLRQGATIATAQTNWLQALGARNTEMVAKLRASELEAAKVAALNAQVAELTEKLSASEALEKTASANLVEANATIAKLKGGKGFVPLADTGGPNGKPANKGKTPGKNSSKDEDMAEDDDDDEGGGTSATDRWNSQINAYIKKGKTKALAVHLVAKGDPELHAEYIAEVNANRL